MNRWGSQVIIFLLGTSQDKDHLRISLEFPLFICIISCRYSYQKSNYNLTNKS